MFSETKELVQESRHFLMFELEMEMEEDTHRVRTTPEEMEDEFKEQTLVQISFKMSPKAEPKESGVTHSDADAKHPPSPPPLPRRGFNPEVLSNTVERNFEWQVSCEIQKLYHNWDLGWRGSCFCNISVGHSKSWLSKLAVILLLTQISFTFKYRFSEEVLTV
jgi:hypothetical protein